MAIVYDLVNDFVNENKVLADALLVEDATVVAEYLHHSINDVQDGGWGHIVLARRHKVDSKLLCKEIVHTVYVLFTSRVQSYIIARCQNKDHHCDVMLTALL